jgi:hypothetical protein
MIRVLKGPAAVVVMLTVSIAAGGEKDAPNFVAGAASSYPNKQSSEQVTVAADVYETGDKVKTAFGKHSPYDSGVLPVLVVIANDSDKAINVDHLKVEYIAPGGEKVAATPAQDLRFLRGASRPGVNPAPLPIPGIPQTTRGKKNPLSDWQIEGRAFAAKVIPPHDSASGFFYFQTGHRSNSKLYLSGIMVPATGKELFYFEVPLPSVQ